MSIAGYDSTTLRATRPPLTRRPDFFPFWAETIAALDRIPANPRLGLAVTTAEGAHLAPVRFTSFGGCDVQGFLATLDDPAAEPAGSPGRGGSAAGTRSPPGPGRRRPLVVTTHGYDSQTNPVLEARHTAACGADLFCFDVRGFGLSRASCPVDPAGHVLTGIDHPRTSILRGAVCDYVRAVQVARRLGAGGGLTVFHGRSFGGSLALMAQATAHDADYLAVSVPTFGWAEGRRRLVKAGSGLEVNHYLARHPSAEAAVMATLSYFDPINFAERVGCPSIVGVGLRDDVVPAPTVYAVINHMTPRPEVFELPVSHTREPEERHWMAFDRHWTARAAALAAAQYSS